MNILVTGATGFLGKNLVESLVSNGDNVVGTGHSELSIRNFESVVKSNKDIPIYAVDISDSYRSIKSIIKTHKIQYVIHAAALKHVSICEKNPTRAVDVNITGSKHVLSACVENDIENAIGISTDKAVNPKCTYGMTKKIMEEMFLENDYGVFQGVNFLFSTGSVLDIWDRLKNEKKTISVNTSATRYFCLIDEVCKSIIDNIDQKRRFTIDRCYEIKIHDLQRAFSKYHEYWNVDEHTPLDVEKINEELPACGPLKLIKPDDSSILELIKNHYSKKETR